MSERHITYDPIYNTVDRDNFDALIEVDRYADRTDAFDSIIASTVDHFWDPTDVRYVDFQSQPMNLEEETIMPLTARMPTATVPPPESPLIPAAWAR